MGTGGLEDELRQQLSPLAARVQFLGFKSWHELPRYYADADVLCAPSRYDGWGLIVPEALASGLPVIGTDRTGAAREFIRNGENGMIITAAQQDSLLDALRRAAAWSPAELDRISDAARATVREHSLENGVKRFLTAVRQSSAAFAN
jgi:glycosyltransferase involved in cell wall biosynthesis